MPLLIGIPMFATVIRAAWWIVGGRAPARLFYITYAYFFGVEILVMGTIYLLSMGFFKVFEPGLYRQFLAASQNPQSMPDLSASPIPLIALGIFLSGYIIGSSSAGLPIGSLMCWGS